jgi:hypothetical protein
VAARDGFGSKLATEEARPMDFAWGKLEAAGKKKDGQSVDMQN